MAHEYIVYVALETDEYDEIMTNETIKKMQLLYKNLSEEEKFPSIGMLNKGFYSTGENEHKYPNQFINEITKFTSEFPKFVFRIYLFYFDCEGLTYFKIKNKNILLKSEIEMKKKIKICEGLETIYSTVNFSDFEINNDITEIIIENSDKSSSDNYSNKDSSDSSNSSDSIGSVSSSDSYSSDLKIKNTPKHTCEEID
jgi:hypothetical protein